MSVEITTKKSKNGQKIYYYLEWGKGPGERVATGKFTWAKPKDQIQRDFNKQVLQIVAKVQAEKTLDFQSIGTSHTPAHRIKPNFIDFFAEYVQLNDTKKTNRALPSSFAHFKKFVKKSFISPVEITENFCERFRKYLLDNLTGSTPADYFWRFKRCLKAAYKQGYFRINVAEDVKAKSHPTKEKEILQVEEYATLLDTYCPNYEVKKAAVVSMYTGMRWCDVKSLKGWQVKKATIKIKQSKTGGYVDVPLHPVARLIIGDIENQDARLFKLPSANQANTVLGEWVNRAGLDKHITWHCLRHSVSDIMQTAGIDVMTVAAMLGQTTAKYILERYKKRVRTKDTEKAVMTLPSYSTEEQDQFRSIALELLGRNDWKN